jgi:hypothetical protein
MTIDQYKVNVPKGESSDYKIKKFIVSEEDSRLDSMRSFTFSNRGRYTPAGEYTSLTCRGEIIMSDTPNEIRDHHEAVRMAKGSVLINGLGIGMVLQAVLEKPEVTDVTVIELSPDVISLVGKHYQDKYGSRLQIINANTFEWTPPKGKRYGMVWHDIWTYICYDNLPEMHKLHRKYGRHADWQGSWCRWQCENNQMGKRRRS